jgi:parallel beta-helix repeat protein
MKKSLSIILIVLFLIALLTICIPPIKAQNPNIISINADGSITPSTAPIQQMGNIYTLTSHVDSNIVIQRSDTTLQGTGNSSVNGYLAINSLSNVTVKNLTITFTVGVTVILSSVSNITLENNTISSGQTPFGQIGGIKVDNSNFITLTGNTIKNGMFGIWLTQSQHNLIIWNNIIGNSNSWGYSGAGIILEGSSNNAFYYNNVINNQNQTNADSTSINTWDNGKEGNYWSDYQSKYPNATEIDSSGIGNTPYVIDANNVDHYPLLSQANTVTPTPIPTTITTPTPTVPEVSWITILPLLVSVFLGAVYFKHRRTNYE